MTRTDLRAFIRKEIVLFMQYAVIASLAASVAHDYLWSCDLRELNPPSPMDYGTVDINPMGILWKWIADFWIPWFTAFLPLALARTIFVALSFWYRGRLAGRTGETAQANTEFRIRHEIRPFLHYLLISFAALSYVLAFYIRDSWLWDDRVPRWLSGEAGIFEVVKTLGERFYGPGLATFFFLASARLLAVFVVRKYFLRRNRA